ncbi:MAG: hypothetical protein OXG35_05540, partial [Acidobacteria bacterium]|nr:hypothetical protein [Acidobacteriota bacterium]
MAGRRRFRARVAAPIARGEPPPRPTRSRDPEAAIAREIERQRLKTLVGGLGSVRCVAKAEGGRKCKKWSVWGLDVCTRHGGLDPERLQS